MTRGVQIVIFALKVNAKRITILFEYLRVSANI